jgi:hypothetical protein
MSHEVVATDKYLITGPARTGTTFLMSVLTDLGLDTGYAKKDADYFSVSNVGGLEWLRDAETRKLDPPSIIKHPSSCNDLMNNVIYIAEDNGWGISHVFLTIRSLNSLVASHVDREARRKNSNAERMRVAKEGRLLCFLPQLMGQLLFQAIEYDFTLMIFPRFVEDMEYCYQCLSPLVGSVDYKEFSSVWSSRANVGAVHFR